MPIRSSGSTSRTHKEIPKHGAGVTQFGYLRRQARRKPSRAPRQPFAEGSSENFAGSSNLRPSLKEPRSRTAVLQTDLVRPKDANHRPAESPVGS
jgi:hypothetical protein